MNTYQENGYKDRMQYLVSLSEDTGIELSHVLALAETLGEDEDFDGLVSALEEYGY